VKSFDLTKKRTGKKRVSASAAPAEKDRYVLDAYAILAVLEDEPGAAAVAKIFTGQAAEFLLSLVNLGEAYYITLRRKGEDAAEQLVNSIFAEESLTLVDASWARIKNAARIKSGGGLSYADSFVVSLAMEIKAPVITGDPEIRKIAGERGIGLIWIGEG